MQPINDDREYSDSDNDFDYVPANDGDSSDGEPDAKRAKMIPPVLTQEQEAANKKAREALWADFQATIPSASSSRPAPQRMVKIEKRYRYAGEEVIEVTEVPEDSDEAKKWPLCKPSPSIEADVDKSQAGPASLPQMQENLSERQVPQSISPSAYPQSAKPNKKPAPRKPKTKLTSAPGPVKAKKLTTLDKSAMDWKSHIAGAQGSSLKDELEANRRGGGYLEKVEFLQRVGERKDEAFDANKPTKRRRG